MLCEAAFVACTVLVACESVDGLTPVSADNGDDGSTQDDDVTDNGDDGSAHTQEVPVESQASGKDPDLELLAAACSSGDFEACDALFRNSPIGSDYEAFGSSCGERNEPGGTSCSSRYFVLSTDVSPRAGAATDRAPGLLVHARNGVHDGFDRFVLEFEQGGLPAYRVRYVDVRPDHADVAGRDFLEVVLDGAALADTVTARPGTPGAVNIVDTLLIDAEPAAVWVIGVNQQTGFEVFTLDDPPRIVIDVGHR